MPLRPWFHFIRFSHTLFALPFAAIGYTIGVRDLGVFHWQPLLAILLCMITNRNAAMAFNRLVDATIDAKNPRTAEREIPKGVISRRGATLFVLLNVILFVLSCAFLNRLVLYLSPVALLIVLGYSLTKRFTWLCHYILGIGLALAPIGAYLGVTGTFDSTTLLLGLGVLFWVGGFDIIYAMQDADFDAKHHLYSIPSYFGTRRAWHIVYSSHILAMIFFTYATLSTHHWLPLLGLGLFGAILLYQHITLCRKGNIDARFMLLNGLNSLLFGVIFVLALTLFTTF